jgi:hypothetical protein
MANLTSSVCALQNTHTASTLYRYYSIRLQCRCPQCTMFCFCVRFSRPRLTRNLRRRAHARDIHHPNLAPRPRKSRPRDPSTHPPPPVLSIDGRAPLTPCDPRYRPHEAIPCPHPPPPHTDLRRGRHPAPVLGPSSASASPRHGLRSFTPLAAVVLGHLRASRVAVLPGLTELELARRGRDGARVPARPPRCPRRGPVIGARVPVLTVARGAAVRLRPTHRSSVAADRARRAMAALLGRAPRRPRSRAPPSAAQEKHRSED